MILGNIASEFGGLYPLLLFTVAIFLSRTATASSGAIVAAAASGVIAGYHVSGLSMIARYSSSERSEVLWAIYGWVLAAQPLLGYALIYWADMSWIWTLLSGLLLGGGLSACLIVGKETRSSTGTASATDRDFMTRVRKQRANRR